MALQDHFHPPLSTHRHWHAFHNAWATYIASDLNHRLPEGYFAEPNVQFGIEIDVATFEEFESSEKKNQLTSTDWQPPTPTQTIPFQPVSESVEINIFNQEQGPTLAGAIELVSPANKDRPANRKAFVSKCEAYLQQKLGLIMIDVVTIRSANLHQELLKHLLVEQPALDTTPLYTVAYQVVEHDKAPQLAIWYQKLAVKQPLPIMPLWLPGSICLPVDLGATYELTCREQRIKS
jgi:hypothetical protein